MILNAISPINKYRTHIKKETYCRRDSRHVGPTQAVPQEQPGGGGEGAPRYHGAGRSKTKKKVKKKSCTGRAEWALKLFPES